MDAPADRDFGPQPLDALLAELGIDNHALVAASTEQLTHKQVQKARKGRYITRNIQGKILAALNALAPLQDVPVQGDAGEGEPLEGEGEKAKKRLFTLAELFTYRA